MYVCVLSRSLYLSLISLASCRGGLQLAQPADRTVLLHAWPPAEEAGVFVGLVSVCLSLSPSVSACLHVSLCHIL